MAAAHIDAIALVCLCAATLYQLMGKNEKTVPTIGQCWRGGE